VRRFLEDSRGVWIPVLAIIGVVVAWALFVSIGSVPTLLLPSPVKVWNAAIESGDDLIKASWSTLSEIVLATLIAVVGGFFTAVLLSLMPRVRRAIFPYILMTQVVPKVALAPILIAWFGIGMQSRLVLAFLIAYFPMVINTLTGLLGTSESMVRYVQSLAGSEWQTLVKVRLPAALPSIMAGVKITTGVAVIGIVVGEFVASDRGLGKIIVESGALMETPLTIAATLAIALIGLLLLGIMEIIERRIVYWHADR
jgi:NitT/TauT family transport system permease protein